MRATSVLIGLRFVAIQEIDLVPGEHVVLEFGEVAAHSVGQRRALYLWVESCDFDPEVFHL